MHGGVDSGREWKREASLPGQQATVLACLGGEFGCTSAKSLMCIGCFNRAGSGIDRCGIVKSQGKVAVGFAMAQG